MDPAYQQAPLTDRRVWTIDTKSALLYYCSTRPTIELLTCPLLPHLLLHSSSMSTYATFSPPEQPPTPHPPRALAHVSSIWGSSMMCRTASRGVRLPSSTWATAVRTGSGIRYLRDKATTPPAVATPSATCKAAGRQEDQPSCKRKTVDQLSTITCELSHSHEATPSYLGARRHNVLKALATPKTDAHRAVAGQVPIAGQHDVA